MAGASNATSPVPANSSLLAFVVGSTAGPPAAVAPTRFVFGTTAVEAAPALEMKEL
jgi:hypothetical protein